LEFRSLVLPRAAPPRRRRRCRRRGRGRRRRPRTTRRPAAAARSRRARAARAPRSLARAGGGGGGGASRRRARGRGRRARDPRRTRRARRAGSRSPRGPRRPRRGAARSRTTAPGAAARPRPACVEIKSSTRLQCARMRQFRHKLFGPASRTRRERSIRPKISRIDFDLAEIERFEVSPDASVPPVDFHAAPGATTAARTDRARSRAKE